MPRILFASDSYKGSITSKRQAELFSEVARTVLPDAVLRSFAVADGGEGTVDALVSSCGGEKRTVRVAGPRGSAAEAAFGMLGEGRAVIEMAAASGLPLLAQGERDPLLTSTYGTGQLICAALDAGSDSITLAIGGSATNDGGMGMARALGARFLAEDGSELAGTGADLGRVASIDISGLDARIAGCTFRIMCDVDSPLLGPSGCAAVFAPQKGASKEGVELLEKGMASYARVLAETFGKDISMQPGAGAAGGLGAGAALFLDAELLPGVECVLDLIGFDDALAEADLIITGEGHADAQSVHGKAVSGIAARAMARGVPCVAIVGGMDADATALLKMGVCTLVPCTIGVCSLDEALAEAERNFSLAVQRVLSLVAIGMGLR